MAVPFISFVHPDDVEATRERGTASPSPAATRSLTHENRYRTRDGDYRYLNWTTVAVDGVLYFAAQGRDRPQGARERATTRPSG